LELRCFGGFVASQHYGIGRETADIDVLSAAHEVPGDDVERLAGVGSPLHRRYRLYVQCVTIATLPADWPQRLEPMFPDAGWKQLRLFALDPIDLVLSKLERGAERDRADMLALAHAGLIDADIFYARHDFSGNAVAGCVSRMAGCSRAQESASAPRSLAAR
jgi:hypothetical protein